MAKRIELLLLHTIENLGIVGDIVKVRPGYARNYLLPHRLADAPTPTKIESLKEARAEALAELSRLRQVREELLARMKDVSVDLVRSCNDQGVLYGSVTQRDVSDALLAAGYNVGVSAVRLSQTIRRVGEYHVPIQFEKDLRTEITLHVQPDRPLEIERETESPLLQPAAAEEQKTTPPEREKGKRRSREPADQSSPQEREKKS